MTDLYESPFGDKCRVVLGRKRHPLFKEGQCCRGHRMRARGAHNRTDQLRHEPVSTGLVAVNSGVDGVVERLRGMVRRERSFEK